MEEVDTRLLTVVVSDQNIRAVKQLPALWPNDVHSIFYKRCWPIVGKSISDMVKSFFYNGCRHSIFYCQFKFIFVYKISKN